MAPGTDILNHLWVRKFEGRLNQPACAGRASQGHRLQGLRKSIQTLVAVDNGENNPLEPFNDGRNVAVLQRMYTGIIGDPGRFLEPPQVRLPVR